MMKYIDADKLIAEIQKLRSETCISESDDYYEYAKSEIIDIINSLQQEQPIRGPHTESWIEETKQELQHEEELLDMRLETLKRIRDKKNQFQQEQPEMELEKEIAQTYRDGGVTDTSNMDHIDYENIARHFYELGLNARKEE